jgi:hypothetical protein
VHRLWFRPSSPEAPHVKRRKRLLLVKDGIGREMACGFDFHVNHSVLLHAANLRHGTDDFTFLPKEGMLWNFSPEKSHGFVRVRTRDLGYQRPAC